MKCLAVPVAGRTATTEELIEYAREEELAAYTIPRQLELCEELSKSAVLRNLRREELRHQELTELKRQAEVQGGSGSR